MQNANFHNYLDVHLFAYKIRIKMRFYFLFASVLVLFFAPSNLRFANDELIIEMLFQLKAVFWCLHRVTLPTSLSTQKKKCFQANNVYK